MHLTSSLVFVVMRMYAIRVLRCGPSLSSATSSSLKVLSARCSRRIVLLAAGASALCFDTRPMRPRTLFNTLASLAVNSGTFSVYPSHMLCEIRRAMKMYILLYASCDFHFLYSAPSLCIAWSSGTQSNTTNQSTRKKRIMSENEDDVSEYSDNDDNGDEVAEPEESADDCVQATHKRKCCIVCGERPDNIIACRKCAAVACETCVAMQMRSTRRLPGCMGDRCRAEFHASELHGAFGPAFMAEYDGVRQEFWKHQQELFLRAAVRDHVQNRHLQPITDEMARLEREQEDARDSGISSRRGEQAKMEKAVRQIAIDARSTQVRRLRQLLDENRNKDGERQVMCPAPDCLGWLDDDRQCTQCCVRVCNKCHSIKGEGDHVCDANVVATVEHLSVLRRRKELKNCPGCDSAVEKDEGCDQMCCGNDYCGARFHWQTLAVVTAMFETQDNDAAREANRRRYGVFKTARTPDIANADELAMRAQRVMQDMTYFYKWEQLPSGRLATRTPQSLWSRSKELRAQFVQGAITQAEFQAQALAVARECAYEDDVLMTLTTVNSLAHSLLCKQYRSPRHARAVEASIRRRLQNIHDYYGKCSVVLRSAPTTTDPEPFAAYASPDYRASA
eukprot:m.25367 g.25367  ORF g.25367 m.25367 type:complete len:620 (+) comp9744_c0_seq1:1233-3092(+)